MIQISVRFLVKGTAAFKPRRPTHFLIRAVEFCNKILTQVEELPGTRITGLSYSLAKIVLNRWLKTKLPTITQLLNVRIPTDAKSQLFAQQKSQKLYFDREAKSLPLVKTGDTVRMKKKNDWKTTTLAKLAHSSINNCDQQRNSLQTKQERHHQDFGN